MDIDFNQKIPIYIQIIDQIKRDIAMQKLKGGDKLPSVREMAENLKVNPNTIQRVYQELERENITYTQRGMGTFIAEDYSRVTAIRKEMSDELIINFIKGMETLGFNYDEIVSSVKKYLTGGRGNE